MTLPSSDPSSLSSELSRARRGDREAFDRLLERVQPKLEGLAENRIGKKLAKHVRRSDILQNTWLDVIQGIGRFDGKTESAFVGWVSAILENNIRRQGRWFGARKRQAPERTSEMKALARALMRENPTPSAEVADAEDLVLVSRGFDAIPEDYRRVITLAVIEGRPHREVAEKLDRTESATRMLLCRARAALSLAIERLENSAAKNPERRPLA